ncbi:SCO family protein [Litoreibacter arenae]|uniref:Cytochrome oxidase biogenesis protein Sco1/SenC/PrrC, putative copper metallochaperone n=1 Tax=Litoreibacter arenae DSM 19593 TaxID=1123360 RepID=S9RTW0_9RHOB|nr:SCO family protein [Litoreibacter arenae]EPX77399.1 Cytochrome oxidase biogenesis protein Sco1/SenC/PrrC, putative copper metallochaperone [Litoreibacter arenae DSM 19593]
MNKIYATTAIGLVVAMLAGTAAFVVMNRGGEDQFASCRSSAVAGGDIGGAFELVSETGETVTNADVITKPTLVYFGYTFCPDVCPLDAARNAEALDLLEERGVDASALFISIDPERDTPEVMAEYTDVMHPRMIGLTGTPEQVKAASQAYKTYYQKQPGDPEYYLVDHSTFTYLVLPEVGFAEFFRRETTPEEIAETVACYATASS